jgi:catechol 2,3-dioxygenase-like lactoylglutathione lyase family enzyme
MLLEHVNLNTSLPEATIAFFIAGLGCAQDPRMGELVNGKVYLNTTIWMNAGLSQFHIPVTNRGVAGPKNSLLRGKIGIDVPSLDELRDRLEALAKHEHIADKGTHFSFQDAQLASGTSAMEVVSPSGVTFIARAAGPEARDTRCYHPGPLSWCLGVSYVDIDCPVGSTPGITRFYKQYFHAIASFSDGVATIRTGPDQVLRFVERASSKEPQHETVAYQDRPEGLHICVYLYDHAGPFERMHADGLLWGNPRFQKLDHGLGRSQFRFKDIVDPEDSRWVGSKCRS